MAFKIPLPPLPEKRLPTPFGGISLPQMKPLVIDRPELDDRRRQAVKQAVGIDGTRVIGIIPYVGGIVGGQLAALHYKELRNILTPEELNKYADNNRRIPTRTGSLLYSFIKPTVTREG